MLIHIDYLGSKSSFKVELLIRISRFILEKFKFHIVLKFRVAIF